MITSRGVVLGVGATPALLLEVRGGVDEFGGTLTFLELAELSIQVQKRFLCLEDCTSFPFWLSNSTDFKLLHNQINKIILNQLSTAFEFLRQ